jgi:ribonuclease HI
MWVTLYADASFRNRGGWGVWLRSEKGRIVRSGECPKTVDDSAAAEIYAALMGIEICLENWPETQGIQVNSDCLMVVNGLYSWSKPIRRDSIRMIQEKIRDILKVKNVRIRCKHHKGHSGTGNTRSWLNDKVDKLAGQHSKGESEKTR